MSIYASLIISEEWNAKCLFSDMALNFLKYKLNISPNKQLQSSFNSFNDIFNLHLPDLPLMHDYSISKKCNICFHKDKCESEYLDVIEDNLMTYIDLREYDEIKQIKGVIVDLNNKINSNDLLMDEDLLLKEYREKRNQTRKMMHTTFPKIKKWTTYSMVAIPTVATGGFLSGSNLLTGLGLGLEVLGGLIQVGLNSIEDKNKWVSFKFENDWKGDINRPI